MSTVPALWALSADELAVVAAIADRRLPPMLELALDEADLVVSEATAVRSLLARGLVVQAEGELALAPGAATYFAPLTRSTVTAEVEIGTAATFRHVVVGDGDSVLVLHERELDVWAIERPAAPFATVVSDLLAELAPATGSAVGGEVRLPAPVQEQAAELAREARWEEIEGLFAASGVPPTSGERWRSALAQAERSGSVVVWRRLDPTTYEVADVRWLESGSAGTWRLIDEADAEDPETIITVASPTDSGTIDAELRQLLGRTSELHTSEQRGHQP